MRTSSKQHWKLHSNSRRVLLASVVSPLGTGVAVIFILPVATQNTAWGGCHAGSVVIFSNIAIFIIKDGDIVGG